MKDVKVDDCVTINQLDTNTNKQLPTGIIYLLDSFDCFAPLQEEEEAQAKAYKIKLALEKLKEAKVKKVSHPSFCIR